MGWGGAVPKLMLSVKQSLDLYQSLYVYYPVFFQVREAKSLLSVKILKKVM